MVIKMKNKKAISPLIATILLIGLTVTIIVIAILWGKNYIEELAAKRGAIAEKEKECQDIKITTLKQTRTAGTLNIVIKNEADFKINRFTFRINGKSTDVQVDNTVLNKLEVKEYVVTFAEDVVGPNINNIEIIPYLKVGYATYVPCSDKAIKVNV